MIKGFAITIRDYIRLLLEKLKSQAGPYIINRNDH